MHSYRAVIGETMPSLPQGGAWRHRHSGYGQVGVEKPRPYFTTVKSARCSSIETLFIFTFSLSPMR